jgi:hypothetical protein
MIRVSDVFPKRVSLSVEPSNSVRFPLTIPIGCAIRVNSRGKSCIKFDLKHQNWW